MKNTDLKKKKDQKCKSDNSSVHVEFDIFMFENLIIVRLRLRSSSDDKE